jgi:hypothetical protein
MDRIDRISVCFDRFYCRRDGDVIQEHEMTLAEFDQQLAYLIADRPGLTPDDFDKQLNTLINNAKELPAQDVELSLQALQIIVAVDKEMTG